MLEYSITETKAKLAAIIAKATAGDEIIVTKMGKEVARIVPPQVAPAKKNLIGLCAGQMKVPDDFDEWPEDIARNLGIID